MADPGPTPDANKRIRQLAGDDPLKTFDHNTGTAGMYWKRSFLDEYI